MLFLLMLQTNCSLFYYWYSFCRDPGEKIFSSESCPLELCFVNCKGKFILYTKIV